MSDDEDERTMAKAARREAAINAGVRAEAVTIVWMIVEAALAVIAGVKARSVLVTSFGIDSVIELLSAIVVLWRIKNDSSYGESVERRAATISGVLLVLLCLYIIASSLAGLVRHIDPEQTALGLVIAALAVVLMPLLAVWKRHINRELQSATLRADIAETAACGYMAGVVVAGILLNRFLSVWWIDYAASLVLLLWIAHEAKEAFEAARGECEDHCENVNRMVPNLVRV
jgi:divalent metal cation (Fe/Co/Zn/Cd) transporter